MSPSHSPTPAIRYLSTGLCSGRSYHTLSQYRGSKLMGHVSRGLENTVTTILAAHADLSELKDEDLDSEGLCS
eukprot:154142-Rhodomonas_salina.1